MEVVARRENAHAAAGETLAALDIDPHLKAEGIETAFGTLCHLAVERRLSGRPDDIPIKIESALDSLGEADRAAVIGAARKLADAFLGTELGRKALAAERRSVEFPFLLPIRGVGERPWLINGTMDLIFEAEGRCVIVDFKTDRRLDPAAHAVQLSAYRAAASAFSDLSVETWLFYLREARAVRVEESLSMAHLAELAAVAAAAATPASADATEDD